MKIQIAFVAAVLAAIPFSPVAAQAPGPQGASATAAPTDDSGSGGSATATDSETPPVPGDAKAAQAELDWLKAKQNTCAGRCDDPGKIDRAADTVQAAITPVAPKKG